MAQKLSSSGSLRRARALVAGAVTAGSLIAGAVGLAPFAAAEDTEPVDDATSSVAVEVNQIQKDDGGDADGNEQGLQRDLDDAAIELEGRAFIDAEAAYHEARGKGAPADVVKAAGEKYLAAREAVEGTQKRLTMEHDTQISSPWSSRDAGTKDADDIAIDLLTAEVAVKKAVLDRARAAFDASKKVSVAAWDRIFASDHDLHADSPLIIDYNDVATKCKAANDAFDAARAEYAASKVQLTEATQKAQATKGTRKDSAKGHA